MSEEKRVDLERVEQVHQAQKLLAVYLFTQAFANARPHMAMLSNSWTLEIADRDLLAVDSFSLRMERTPSGVRITVARPGAVLPPGSTLINAADEDEERDGPRG